MVSDSSLSVTKHLNAVFRTGTALGQSDACACWRGASEAMNSHRSMTRVAALLLMGVAAASAGMGMRARSASPQPDPRASTQLANPRIDPTKSENHPRTDPRASTQLANHRYRITMAGSTTFEVVAVSEHYSSPKNWWRPDGTLLAETPADPSRDAYSGHTGEELLDILVRVKNLPTDATLKWVPTYDHSCLTYLGGVAKDGKALPELRAYVVSIRPDRKSGSVQIQLATGPWKTVVSESLSAGVTTIKDGHKFYFGRPRSYDGGTTIAVAHNLVDADVHNRLVAVDYQGNEHSPRSYTDADALTAHSFVNHYGREHPASYRSGAGREILSMLDAEFALPPDQIREFRVQSRPFERAEIKDIALHPQSVGK
jgi:hypothetical protein